MTTKITDKNISLIANSAVQWQSVVVADGSTGLTAEAGKGYFIDTTSATQSVTLPGVDDANIGDTIVIKDFARTFATNNVTIASNLFEGNNNAVVLNTDNLSRTFVYTGDTNGYTVINDDTTTAVGAEYIAATGGTVATSGNFKIHTFTGDGCFVVSCAGNAAGSNTVDYLVVAGGGAGGGANGGGGGGGAGGLRYSDCTYCTPAPDPSSGTALPVSAQTYPVTVGGGGSPIPTPGGPTPSQYQKGGDGSNSIFSTITSAGGGGGAGGPCTSTQCGANGGSGGGGGKGGSTPDPVTSGGSGNTPPVSPPQGNNGGSGGGGPIQPSNVGGGGGGAGAVGGNAGPGGGPGGNGGNGLVISINGSCTAYAGGGGGQAEGRPGAEQGTGGSGGGGAGRVTGSAGYAGTANTGGGGGGIDSVPSDASSSGAGGKGIVIIRYQFQAS